MKRNLTKPQESYTVTHELELSESTSTCIGFSILFLCAASVLMFGCHETETSNRVKANKELSVQEEAIKAGLKQEVQSYSTSSSTVWTK